MAKAASVEELLKSGAHFGHLTRRWNPKMREFIFMQRNGIHIIDLNKTHALLQEALDEITKVARSGKKVLFVGTKKQAQEIIKTEASRCDMPYVTHRWLGGMLTNFVTIRKSISRMEEINAMQTDGTYENITKKERLMLDREKEKLEDVMGGISKMGRIPGALFVVDIVKENIAVNEALKLNIPIFALVDTNCDPDVPDYIIPCNDDAAKAIQLVASNVADAIIEGMAEREAYQEEQLAAESISREDDEGQEVAEPEVKTTRRKRTRKAKTSPAQDKPSAKKEEAAPKADTRTGDEDKAGEKDAAAEVKDTDAEQTGKKDDAKAGDEGKAGKKAAAAGDAGQKESDESKEKE
jgi:small subunit ribosomal protein S2